MKTHLPTIQEALGQWRFTACVARHLMEFQASLPVNRAPAYDKAVADAWKASEAAKAVWENLSGGVAI